MTVQRSQTVEDGGPRQRIERMLLRDEHEWMRVVMDIRRPYALENFTKRLVIHACIGTESVVASLLTEQELSEPRQRLEEGSK